MYRNGLRWFEEGGIWHLDGRQGGDLREVDRVQPGRHGEMEDGNGSKDTKAERPAQAATRRAGVERGAVEREEEEKLA